MIVYNDTRTAKCIFTAQSKNRKQYCRCRMSGKRGIPMRDSDAFQNRPVSMNPKNNLLEIEEHMYILDDVEKPNVFRNTFPYSENPKIPFNDRIVPHNMPKDIWITDTTFRDGQQSRAPYHRADRKDL